MNRQTSYILILVILVLVLELPRMKAVWKALTKKRSLAKTTKSRELKAKTPIDCPYCGKGEHKESIPPPDPTLIPYNQTNTQGYSCPNPDCYYYQVTDERIHALIGYGSHGKHERIPDLYCQACKTKFTTRMWTILYRLKTLSKIIILLLSLLVLGMDASALQEALGIQESTLRNGLVRSGAQSRKLHEHFFWGYKLWAHPVV